MKPSPLDLIPCFGHCISYLTSRQLDDRLKCTVCRNRRSYLAPVIDFIWCRKLTSLLRKKTHRQSPDDGRTREENCFSMKQNDAQTQSLICRLRTCLSRSSTWDIYLHLVLRDNNMDKCNLNNCIPCIWDILPSMGPWMGPYKSVNLG